MKKLLLSFLLISLTFVGFCQQYFRLPDSNAVWREHITTQYSNSHFQFGIIGDTVIQSNIYHKLYYKQNSLIDTAMTTTNAQLIGAIREDDEKRVFFYNFSYQWGDRGLIYKISDFSANIGDTVTFSTPSNDYHYNFPYMVLNSIDSIYAYDQYRKQYHFSTGTWIEGIGNTRSLLSVITPYPTCFCINEVVCFKQNDIRYYLNPAFNDCYNMSYEISESPKLASRINVYPNPISSAATFDFSQFDEAFEAIEIFNVMGKKISEHKIANNKVVIIDFSTTNPGLYYFKTFTTNNSCYSGKFIIE